MAKLTFYGAIEGVTGSAYLLETGDATLLLECGLIQGNRKMEKGLANTRKLCKSFIGFHLTVTLFLSHLSPHFGCN